MRIVFIGPPGSGKGTQAVRLSQHLDVPHLSTGDMLRAARDEHTEIGNSVHDFLVSGRLVPDPVMLELIGGRLKEADCVGGCVLDGFPRTLAQAEALDEFLSTHVGPLDVAIVLVVDEEELVTRLAGRQRADDQPDVIRRRLKVYKQQVDPIAEHYEEKGILRNVDGIGTPDEVYQRIQVSLQGVER